MSQILNFNVTNHDTSILETIQESMSPYSDYGVLDIEIIRKDERTFIQFTVDINDADMLFNLGVYVKIIQNLHEERIKEKQTNNN